MDKQRIAIIGGYGICAGNLIKFLDQKEIYEIVSVSDESQLIDINEYSLNFRPEIAANKHNQSWQYLNKGKISKKARRK